jgi:hypothetical protein
VYCTARSAALLYSPVTGLYGQLYTCTDGGSHHKFHLLLNFFLPGLPSTRCCLTPDDGWLLSTVATFAESCVTLSTATVVAESVVMAPTFLFLAVPLFCPDALEDVSSSDDESEESSASSVTSRPLLSPKHSQY